MVLVQTVQQLRQIARIGQPCYVRLRRRATTITSTHLHAGRDTLAQPAPLNRTPTANTQNADPSRTRDATNVSTLHKTKHVAMVPQHHSTPQPTVTSHSPMPAHQRPTSDQTNHGPPQSDRHEHGLQKAPSAADPHSPHASSPLFNPQLHATLEIPDEPHVDTTQESATSQPIRLSQLPFDIPEEPNLDTSQETLSPSHRHTSLHVANTSNAQRRHSSPCLSQGDSGQRSTSSKQVPTPDHPFSMPGVERDPSTPRVETPDKFGSHPPDPTAAVPLRLRVRPPGPVYLTLPVRMPERKGGQKARFRRFRKRRDDYSMNESSTLTMPHSYNEGPRQRSQKRRRLLRNSHSNEAAHDVTERHGHGFPAPLSCQVPCSEPQRGQQVKSGGPAVPLRLRLRLHGGRSRAPTAPFISNATGDMRRTHRPQSSNAPAPWKATSTRLGRRDRSLGGGGLRRGRESSPLRNENAKKKDARIKRGAELKVNCDIEVLEEFEESSDITTQSPAASDTAGGDAGPGESTGSKSLQQTVAAVVEKNGAQKLSRMPFAVCISGVSKDSAELELAEALIPLRGAEFSDGFDCDPTPSCVLTTFDANNRIQQPRMVVFEAMARRVPIVNIAWLVASHAKGFLVDTGPFEATSDHRKSGPGVFEGLVATIDKAFDEVGVPAMVQKAGRDIRRLLRAGGAIVVECGELGQELQGERGIVLHIHVINDFGEEQTEVEGSSKRKEELRASQQNVPTKVVSIGWIGECLGMGAFPPLVQSCRLDSSSWQSSVVEECR